MRSIFWILILFSSHLLAAEPTDPTNWTIRYLARASNLLLVANDAALDKKPLLCGIKHKEPPALILNLQKIIDQKIKNLTPEQRQKIYDDGMNCDKFCTCDIYSLALEKDQSLQGGKILELVNVQGKKLGPQDRLVCAQNFREFCHGSLLKAIRSH